MTGTPPELPSEFGRSLFDGLEGIWGLAGGCAGVGRCGGPLYISLGGSLKNITYIMKKRILNRLQKTGSGR